MTRANPRTLPKQWLQNCQLPTAGALDTSVSC